MENPGCVTIDERKYLFKDNYVTLYKDMRRTYILLHEMAHMWMGDYVTPK